jgi:hypothetical protein
MQGYAIDTGTTLSGKTFYALVSLFQITGDGVRRIRF